MPAIEIRSVSPPAETHPELVHSDLDVTVPDGWDQFAVPIAGNVVVRAGGPRARRVEVLCSESVVQTAPLLPDRPDAARAATAAPDDSPRRFELLASVIGLPAEFELRVVAVLHDESRTEIGSVSARHEPVRSGYEPGLQPLMLTTLGRTGSTLLMMMLGAHEGVVVQGRFPFELWPARYWMHVFKVLTHPRDALRSDDAYHFDQDELRVGPNPYYLPRVASRPELGNLLGRAHVESLAAMFQAQIDKWYATVARRQGAGEPRYFAEKHLLRPNGTQPIAHELYPSARELFLVRDFRDIAASAIDFSEKRGQLMAGWPSGKSAHDYVREDLRSSAVEFCRAWRRRQEEAHLVRYEDLVQRPVDTLAGVLAYLGLGRDEETIERMIRQGQDTVSEPRVHITSPSAAASIGRWREEDDRGLRNLLGEAFSDLLPQFGYVD